MKNIFSKKGVSPIVASVLLVVITIAIGATTMAFLRSLTDSNLEKTKEQTSKISCGSDINLVIATVRDELKICYYETGEINLMLQNRGVREVTGFIMTTIKTDGTIDTNNTISVSIAKDAWMGSTNFSMSSPVTTATTEVLQWRIEPKLSGPGGTIVCSDAVIAKDIEDISLC